MKKKVIELIRVSTEGQAADCHASIPAQRSVNQRTCGRYGLEIVKSVQVSDVSGASVLLAPEIQQLLKLMQSPEIEGVVAREFSRLMRPENFADYALLQTFVDSHTILYLEEGPIDLTSKTGRLMGTIRAAIAGLERTEILERVWVAKEEKRRRGELGQSEIVLPFGVGYEKVRGFYYKPDAEKVREAIRRFLGGYQSYSQLAKFVGVTPRGMHLIMRNPIWTGWRVIDKKRDGSPSGRYAGVNGRQADRRKVARPPDEIIRVQVIDKPLVSEADFQAVQRIMDLKQSKHWRSQPEIRHRFTYNGFLTCAACGEVIHTALARRDYYACKRRRTVHRCAAKYMERRKLETILDGLFAEQLASATFLERCVEDLKRRSEQADSAARLERMALGIARLRGKRDRVIDTFVDGILSRQERDRRLAAINHDPDVEEGILLRERPSPRLDAAALIDSFAPLLEWNYWTRDQKRQVLAALVPDIRVANYKVDALGLSPAVFSNQDTRTDTDSSLPPA